jgi:hypothetical protein
MTPAEKIEFGMLLQEKMFRDERSVKVKIERVREVINGVEQTILRIKYRPPRTGEER